MDERTLEAKARMGELCARLTRAALRAETLEDWPDSVISESMRRELHSLKGLCMGVGAGTEAALVHELESLLEETREHKAFGNDVTEKFLVGLDKLAKFSDGAILPKAEGSAQRQRAGDATPHPDAPPPSRNAARRHESTPSPARAAPESEPSRALQGVPRDADNFLRVQVSLLDHLMGLVSELVLIRNQLHQFTQANDDRDFVAVSQRLDVVTSSLQSEVMRMRMQPVSTVTLRFQRVVRDLSKELGKLVEMHLEGNETEIDKTIVEALRDPLMHLVRNALDHGIETPEERIQAGKPQRGKLTIRTFQEGGQVILELHDDGRGIDPARVARKAIENGIATQERLSRMSKKEVLSLIFAPGFSTAERITELSGRGVGMDVVRSNVEQIGGVVDLASIQGKGTTFSLRIPLTLAIVPALIVRCGRVKCAIPQVKIVELVRLASDDDPESGGLQPEMLEGGPVVRLRGRLLPLLSLTGVLLGESPSGTRIPGASNVVIVRSDGHDFALAVEDVSDSIDIVVKPFVGFLKSLRLFSGATILGDGGLALILDIAGLRERCAFESAQRPSDDSLAQGDVNAARAQRVVRGANPEFLLCGVGEKEVVAIPLPQVFRLEEFHAGSVEIASGAPVARYREGLLPLIHLASALGISSEFQDVESIESLVSSDRLDVVVTQRHGRLFGLVVSRIEDIINTLGEVNELVRPHRGALGTILEGTNVHTVVNVSGVVDTWLAEVLGEVPPPPEADKRPSARLLLVEDSNFFRKYTASVLEGASYEVRAAANGREALDVLAAAAPGSFDLILTDIDMPGLSGMDLAREVRASDAWYKELTIVALTSLVSPRDRALAKSAGIDEHIEKVNLNQIPALLASVLGRLWEDIKEGAA